MQIFREISDRQHFHDLNGVNNLCEGKKPNMSSLNSSLLIKRARDELCGIFIYASESMPSADDKPSLVTKINSISVSENDNGEHWRSNWHFGIGIIELRVIFNDFLAGIFFLFPKLWVDFFILLFSVYPLIRLMAHHIIAYHGIFRLSNQFTHTILLVTQ